MSKITRGWKDLTGMKFDKLMVIKRVDDYVYPSSGKHEPRWLCVCDCEEHNEIEVVHHNLLNGHVHCCKSCKKNGFKDITGQTFGKLTVVKQGPSYITPTGKKEVQWYCNCSCGKANVLVRGHNLRNGHTTSCGCAQIEASTTHGLSKTKEYKLYHGIKNRCTNENIPAYKNYGGRGITINDEWYNPTATKEERIETIKDFCKWAKENKEIAKEKYGEDALISINRVNNDGNYSPDNCEFTDPKVQANNRRSNVDLTYKGETHTAAEWADILHIDAFNIYHRLNMGWSVEKTLETPVNDYMIKLTNSNGETHTLSEWSKIVGINRDIIYDRITKLHMPVDDALYKPVDISRRGTIIEYNGNNATMNRWDKALGFGISTISHNIKNNTMEQIISARSEKRPVNGIYFLDENDNPISQDEFINKNGGIL